MTELIFLIWTGLGLWGWYRAVHEFWPDGRIEIDGWLQLPAFLALGPLALLMTI